VDAAGRSPENIEIERKFLVAHLPGDLGAHPVERVDQGYLAVGADGVEVRIRRRGDRHVLTVKSGTGRLRVEEEIDVGARVFDSLWGLTEGRRVEKLRHLLPAPGGLTIELDVYAGALDGLVVAEVEFDSPDAAAAFVPPAWFGDEVTGDERYLNRTLAQAGAPE
jgi:CYTH domain-containing protein